MRRLLALIGAVWLITLTLASCGDDEEAPATTAATTTTTQATTTTTQATTTTTEVTTTTAAPTAVTVPVQFISDTFQQAGLSQEDADCLAEGITGGEPLSQDNVPDAAVFISALTQCNLSIQDFPPELMDPNLLTEMLNP